MIIIATVELTATHNLMPSTLDHYGLARGALHQTSVAHTAGCRGFVRHYLFQLLITLRYATAIMGTIVQWCMKTLLWNSLNFIYSKNVHKKPLAVLFSIVCTICYCDIETIKLVTVDSRIHVHTIFAV